jgi:hypothetical protein
MLGLEVEYSASLPDIAIAEEEDCHVVHEWKDRLRSTARRQARSQKNNSRQTFLEEEG